MADSPRNYPHAHTTQALVLASIRDQTSWNCETDVLAETEARLCKLNYTPHARPVLRWVLYTSLRDDDRVERRAPAHGSVYDAEYRFNVEWPRRYAAEVTELLELRRAAGANRFLPAEHLRKVRNGLELLIRETWLRYGEQLFNKWRPSVKDGWQGLYDIALELGWNPQRMSRAEPWPSADHTPPRAIVAEIADRIVTCLVLIAGDWLPKFQATPAPWKETVGVALDWLRVAVDRLHNAAIESSLAPSERRRRCDTVDSEWAAHADALRSGCPPIVTGAVAAACDRASAALDRFAAFAREHRDSNNENDRDAFATLALATRDAWYELRESEIVPHESDKGFVPDGTTGKGNIGRGKRGQPMWRNVQSKLLERAVGGTLPSTLRDAAKLTEATYDTARRAARRSPILAAQFKSDFDPTAAGDDAGSILAELATQADAKTRQDITRMTPRERREAEEALRKMTSGQQIALLRALATNPDSSTIGIVSLIENVDQHSRVDVRAD